MGGYGLGFSIPVQFSGVGGKTHHSILTLKESGGLYENRGWRVKNNRFRGLYMGTLGQLYHKQKVV